jgi:aminoglycoside phosphotransferase
VSEPVPRWATSAAPAELLRHLSALQVLAGGPRCGDSHDALVRPEATIGALGSVLSRLHRSRPPEALAARLARRRPADLLDEARRAVKGDGPAPAPGGPYAHLPPRRLLEVLEAGVGRVGHEAAVLVHGAPTLDRLCGESVPDGLDDWARVAVADPHLDLAVAARDVVARLGPPMVPVLARSYGAESIDPIRLDWYSLAIELIGDPPAPQR